jgi:hypothetical protein
MRASRLAPMIIAWSITLGSTAGAADVPAAPPPLTDATAQAQATAFRDVPPNSFAYKAIQTLYADGLVIGYPDGEFKGNRPLTRYEAAVITERVVEAVQNRIQQAQAVSARDLAALRTLLDTFRNDIDTLNRRVAQLDTRVGSVERDTASLKTDTQNLKTAQSETQKEADELAAIQKRQQFHLLYFLRAPGSFSDAVSGFSANGAPLPPGTSLVTNSGLCAGCNTSQNKLNTGQYSLGTGYQVLRAFFDGEVNPGFSYHFRLESRYYFANASNNGSSNGSTGTASTVPNYCNGSPGATITTCGNNYPTNATLRLNYANAVYAEPSGVTLTVGRFVASNSGLSLNYSDYFNGGMIGYQQGPFNVSAGYSFNYPELSNGTGCGTAAGSPSCSGSGQTVFAAGSYAFTKKINGSISWATDINPQLTLWNPAAPIAGAPGTSGLYQSVSSPISVGSAYLAYNPTQNLSLRVEGLHRFGNDPFTGKGWTDPNAVWADARYGMLSGTMSRGGYVEGGYINAGFNSLSGHNNIISTTNYQQFYIGNANGYQMGYAALHYWLSQNFRLSVGSFGYDVRPGTTIPASSATCPGCYITHDNGQAYFVQSLLQF